ncbi:MAG: haloacid dehalogenase type II [Planctomycetaceae bacterium]|nr:haloacid dehalogenase type II [Planctomycetaceae bacterium]
MDARLQQVEVLTFDCYGTLIDWEAGLRNELADLRARHGVAASVDELLRRWEAIQFRLIQGPYRRYREILRESLVETFAAQGVALSATEAERLGDTIGSWPPFPDTSAALGRLGARYQLAILSNIDDAILAASVAQLGVSFAELITAEQVGSYKPNPAHFREALRRFDRPAGRFLHCAFGFKYDQSPALARGMQTVWVKRPGWIRDDEATPTFEVDSLAALAELLEA